MRRTGVSANKIICLSGIVAIFRLESEPRDLKDRDGGNNISLVLLVKLLLSSQHLVRQPRLFYVSGGGAKLILRRGVFSTKRF